MELGFAPIGRLPIALLEFISDEVVDEAIVTEPIGVEDSVYDYKGIAQSRLTSEFDNSTRLQALMGEIVSPLLIAEKNCDELKNERWIATAYGKQLDNCGYIVGMFRKGMNDEDFRQEIYRKIMINLSLATPPDLIKIIKAITLPWVCQYYEMRNAFCCLYTDGLGRYIPKNIQSTIQLAAPGGIATIPVCVGYATDSLRFDYDASLTISGQGALSGREDKAYITGEDANIILNTSKTVDGILFQKEGLGGLSPADVWLNTNRYLLMDNGAILVLNSSEFETPYGGKIVCGVF